MEEFKREIRENPEKVKKIGKKIGVEDAAWFKELDEEARGNLENVTEEQIQEEIAFLIKEERKNNKSLNLL